MQDDQAIRVDRIQGADNLFVNRFSSVITIEEYEIERLLVVCEKMSGIVRNESDLNRDVQFIDHLLWRLRKSRLPPNGIGTVIYVLNVHGHQAGRVSPRAVCKRGRNMNRGRADVGPDFQHSVRPKGPSKVEKCSPVPRVYGACLTIFDLTQLGKSC